MDNLLGYSRLGRLLAQGGEALFDGGNLGLGVAFLGVLDLYNLGGSRRHSRRKSATYLSSKDLEQEILRIYNYLRF